MDCGYNSKMKILNLENQLKAAMNDSLGRDGENIRNLGKELSVEILQAEAYWLAPTRKPILI